MSDKILVTRSSMPSLDEYVDEIKCIWESHWMTNMGVKHKTLAQSLKQYLCVPEIELLVNGHLALELTMQAFNLPKGGEVITTPFTFVSTTHSIVRNGLTPVFCDINDRDYTIDADKIEDLITDKTVAIVPVHVYGNICDVEKIDKIAKKHNLKVIYDAAHAFGVKYKGNGIGSYGDASIFSFHATKVFNTIEGGCVTFADEEIGKKLYKLKNFGIAGQEVVDYIGSNAKMNEFSAAMGICNLRHIDEEMEKRRLVKEKYDERLSKIDGITISANQDNVSKNYAYYPIVVDVKVYGATRNDIFDKLCKSDIFPRKYFYPLTNKIDCYKGVIDPGDTKVADYVSERVLTLPFYADLPFEKVDEICDIIEKR